jgi:hypothetical protein
MDKNTRYAEELAAVVDSVEAGAILEVSPERAKQFAREGRLAAKRLGRDWVFSRSAAEDLAKIERPIGLPLPRKKKAEKKRGKRR